MSDFLDRMAAGSRERARVAREREPMGRLVARARSAAAPLALRLERFDLIAELKLRSPAAGALAATDFDAAHQLEAYAKGGAAAISVLTEPDEFRGSLQHLEAAAEQLRPRACPVMRKDFLVDAYQVVEARAHGASGVLLIAAMLSDADLDELLAAAAELGLFVLLEAFDLRDLDRLARIDLPPQASRIMVGVNSRDLRTLAVDFERFSELAGRIRDDVPAVAESGIENADDVGAVAGLGYRLALVGSALMGGDDVERTVADFIAAGRRAAERKAGCS
jgi:indole-3-glycerol phosphate synthase